MAGRRDARHESLQQMLRDMRRIDAEELGKRGKAEPERPRKTDAASMADGDRRELMEHYARRRRQEKD